MIFILEIYNYYLIIIYQDYFYFFVIFFFSIKKLNLKSIIYDFFDLSNFTK